MRKNEQPVGWKDPEYWRQRNEERRRRYQEDPEYRNKMIEQTRASYRRAAGGVETFDCRDVLSYVDDFGEIRLVKGPNGDTFHDMSFTRSELAEVIGCKANTLGRWVRDRRWPDAIFTAETAKKGGDVSVYLEHEVRALCQAFGPHQAETPYYRSAHTEVRNRVFYALERARHGFEEDE